MTRRVLLVNKFYYPRGGDCVAVLNTQSLLRTNGVDAQVFAMRYSQNLPADYQELFASGVNFGGTRRQQWNALQRAMGHGDVVDRFEQVLDQFKPQVVHLNNIHSYLSPVVGRLAHRRGCRVVWTLHDYKLLCPRYDCLRNGKPCELCYTGGKRHVVTHRCMKDSLPASVVAWLEAVKWNRRTLERHTDLFICPSHFMADKMRSGGFDANKLVVLNNFLDPIKQRYYNDTPAQQRQDYYCYVGRLSAEKGVETLLKVASQLPYTLKVAGSGPMDAELRMRYAGCDNIQFLGMLDASGVASLLSQARFAVTPSQWYENNPLSIAESLCAGTPVIGSRMGGIPELIDESNGLTFTSGNHQELSSAIDNAMRRQWDHDAIGDAARKRFAASTHLSRLLQIYGY